MVDPAMYSGVASSPRTSGSRHAFFHVMKPLGLVPARKEQSLVRSSGSSLVANRFLRHGRRACLPLICASLLLLATSAPRATAAQAESPAAPGVYTLVGAVYGTDADGLIGGETSSGHRLRADDRLVALPGCTISSCPWLAPGVATAASGPQTSCAEADGLCWVELTNPETATCLAAPVRDLGPFFHLDNWWAPPAERSYALDQGIPAATVATAGGDVGYGAGISDNGTDLTAKSPLALSVSAGAWTALGLSLDAGVAPLRVRLLWQAELFHYQACGSDAESPENATTTDVVNLRAAPSTDGEVLATVPGGRRITLTGAAENGFLPALHGGREGWIAADLVIDDRGEPAIGSRTTEVVNLRAGPSGTDEVIAVLPAAQSLRRTGEPVAGYVPVVVDGIAGWVAAAYLEGAEASP